MAAAALSPEENLYAHESKTPLWRTWWFNALAMALYTIVGFAIASWTSSGTDPRFFWIIGGVLWYSFGNVHFVLWFTYYTRYRKALQAGRSENVVDEIPM